MTTTTLTEVLEDLVQEAVQCKRRIQREQETIEELRRIAREDLRLSPKDFNTYLQECLDKL